MATQARWRELQDLSAALQAAKERRLVRIDRPLVLHRRNKTGEACGCGCGSKKAIEVARFSHIDVIIDRVTGERFFRSEETASEFDALAESADYYYQPFSFHDAQLPMINDLRRGYTLKRFRKLFAAFGGSRSGKTTLVANLIYDCCLLLGGRGALAMWVSPQMKQTRIAVKMFCIGSRTDRSQPPIIHPDLITYYPKNELAQRQEIELFDGTAIGLFHGSGNGDSLKGVNAIAVAMDEATAIKSGFAAVLTVALSRLQDSGGPAFMSTTPVLGHDARELVALRGKHPDAAGPNEIACIKITCRKNPWQSEQDIEDTIAALGDPRMVAREVDGEWVGNSLQMWEHWKPESMIVTGDSRDIESLGLKNITASAARKFFRGTDADLTTIGGLDFNIVPMSLECIQIGCEPDKDPSDPANWHVYVVDEVVRPGGVSSFAPFLAEQAGSEIGLRSNHFAKMAISCDASGDHQNAPESHGTKSATLAEAMRREGFDCRPCQRSIGSDGIAKPRNPPKLDQCAVVHRLMREGRFHVSYRCKKLIKAIETQEADSRGCPFKEPGTSTDRLSGPMDALLYGLWPHLGHHLLPNTKTKAWGFQKNRQGEPSSRSMTTGQESAAP